MALPTWGMLAKNQDDPEKIEEAIARMIAEHNDDEAAHLGVGQSLQSHKASEIIDHLISSVVADKFSASQIFVRTQFESIDGWDYSGLAPQHNWPKVLIHSGETLEEKTEFWAEGGGQFGLDSWQKNLFFQTAIRLNISSGANFQISIGCALGGDDGVCFGFKNVGIKLHGFFNNWGSVTSVELQDVPRYTDFTVRAMIDSAADEINFYVNGVLKGTLALPEISSGDEWWPYFMIQNQTQGVDEILNIYDLMLVRDE